jgi:hypothetical protein
MLTIESNRATQEDEMGQRYLANVDFLKTGVPASIVAATVNIVSQYENTHSRIE